MLVVGESPLVGVESTDDDAGCTEEANIMNGQRVRVGRVLLRRPLSLSLYPLWCLLGRSGNRAEKSYVALPGMQLAGGGPNSAKATNCRHTRRSIRSDPMCVKFAQEACHVRMMH